MDFDKAIDFVIPPHMKDVIEADGVRYLKANKDKKMPTFILCDSMHQSEPWLQNFLEEHTYYFVNACKEEGVEVHLELVDTEGHKIHYKMPEVIEAFNKYAKPKYLDLMHLNISLDGYTLSVHCTLGEDYPFPDTAQYAFYFMYKGEKKEVKWYGMEGKTVFILEKGIDIKMLEIIAFVKDENGTIISKTSKI